MDLEQELNDLSGLEEWLKNQGHAIAGSARRDCECPLSRFLSAKLGDRVQVSRRNIAIGDSKIQHTKLSYEFARLIDDGRSNGQSVSATAALTALQQARKTVGTVGGDR